MKGALYDFPYGEYDQEDDQQFKDKGVQNMYKDVRRQFQRNQYLEPKKKNRRKKASRFDRQQLFDTRYKGKSRQPQFKQPEPKKISYKQRIRQENKDFNFEVIFNEEMMGNKDDTPYAAIIYRNTVEELVSLIILNELQASTLRKGKILIKEKVDNKKQEKKQAIKAESKDQNHKRKFGQAEPISLEGVKQDPIKKQQPSSVDENRIIQQVNGKSPPMNLSNTPQLLAAYEKFKQQSKHTRSSSIICLIPYKSIPSSLFISFLNFIIKHTAENHVKDTLTLQNDLIGVYSDIHAIAVQSKRYLIEEKLKKGMLDVTGVEKKIAGKFRKDKMVPKLNANEASVQQESSHLQSARDYEIEERKLSSNNQDTTLEERKENTQFSGNNSPQNRQRQT